MVIGQFIGSIFAVLVFDGSAMEFFQGISSASEFDKYKLPLFILQGSASFTGLFILPALYLKVAEKINPTSLISKRLPLLPWLLTGFITLAFMPVNSMFIEWNANVHFPEFMDGFESWARETEEAAARITEQLTQFNSLGEFLIGFIVIAIFAALGEELVFRGMIQNMLHKSFGNIHAAIWISAVLFSMIHLQFFGFVPRMLLGALFGYLYYWSGSLWIPIFAHLVNNGFMLVLIYLNTTGFIDFDLENSETAPWLAVLIFAIITAGLMFYFRNYFIKYNSSHDGLAESIHR
ncbi:MAG: CPBP family intramembrane glutamic endopeptidase [Bacteroidota bacterium]